MTLHDTRPFHLHYHVPDVAYAQEVLRNRGLPLRAVFGVVDGDTIALEPGEEPPEGFRFRLQDAQRGYANVTLTRGKQLQFVHVGIVSAHYDRILERAREADWTIHGEESPRTFLITPWGFRIELHPADGRIADSLGSWEQCRFESLVLCVASPSDVHAGIRGVVGDIPGLEVGNGRESPHVPRATLAGEAFPEEVTVEASSLVAPA